MLAQAISTHYTSTIHPLPDVVIVLMQMEMQMPVRWMPFAAASPQTGTSHASRWTDQKLHHLLVPSAGQWYRVLYRICAWTCIVWLASWHSTFQRTGPEIEWQMAGDWLPVPQPPPKRNCMYRQVSSQRPFALGRRPVPAPALASASGTEQLGEMRQCLERL